MEIMTSLGTDNLDFGSGIKLAVKAVIILWVPQKTLKKKLLERRILAGTA